MLQIIVYGDPIPTRLLLNHHSTHTAVPAWRYDSSRQAFSEASPAAGNLGAIAIPQIPFALATCRALESEEATAISPSALTTCRALEEEEAMAKT
jgi:hypothetical protein